MAPTSGTYNFQSVQVELLIREAFERIGIIGEFVEPLKLESARRSINLLLLSWIDKDVNLWTLQNSYLGLVQGQRQYTLSNTLNNIIQANLRISTRQLLGTPQTNTGTSYDNAGGGTALDAFDGNPATSCLQTTQGGNISYDYGDGNTNLITFIGIQSNAGGKYDLKVEYNLGDPTVLVNWNPLVELGTISLTAGKLEWFDVPTPVLARAYRLQLTGAQTLDMQEIYFNNNTFDFAISNVSRYEYNTYPNKYQQGRPSVYYLDRQITPILNVWPTAASQYNCLFYSYTKVMQDVALYTQSIDIPARFYPALVWGLSWQLALKFNPQLADMLEAKYMDEFGIASTQDSESVPISIMGERA